MLTFRSHGNTTLSSWNKPDDPNGDTVGGADGNDLPIIFALCSLGASGIDLARAVTLDVSPINGESSSLLLEVGPFLRELERADSPSERPLRKSSVGISRNSCVNLSSSAVNVFKTEADASSKSSS